MEIKIFAEVVHFFYVTTLNQWEEIFDQSEQRSAVTCQNTDLYLLSINNVYPYNNNMKIILRESYTFIHPETYSKNIVSPLGQWQCGCQFGTSFL